MPQFRLSPRERRMQNQPDELQERQLNLQSQDQMMRQLATILGIQEQQQQAPLKMEAMRGENESRALQNQYYGANAESAARLQGAQAKRLEDFDPNMLTMEDVMRYVGATGQMPGPEFGPSLPPGLRQGQEAQRAQVEAQRQEGIKQEQAQRPENFIGPKLPAGPAYLEEMKPGRTNMDVLSSALKFLPEDLTDKASRLSGPITLPFRQLRNILNAPKGGKPQYAPVFPGKYEF